MAQETGTTRAPISLILIVILVLVLAWFGWDMLFWGKPPIVSYAIISTEDVSTADESRGVIHAKVQSTTPSLRELRSAALEIRQTTGSEWDMLTLFYYLPGMDADETAYAVARFNAQGLETIRLVQADPAEPEEEDMEPL